MRGIRSRDTKPELSLRSALHRRGMRFRLKNRYGLPCRPDIIFPRQRAAVFVHGCYWHRHTGCRLATTPSTNREIWLEKFAKNVERDRRNLEDLAKMGWASFVAWECELRGQGANKVAGEIADWLPTSSSWPSLIRDC
ncbi:MAG: DNA mismatch endonuclease Vsr [Qipengyuania sp.]|uniref:very short patch repair endonuclease n=1 Tax=Qipengyuania sp. TaxID=2004515 RepID=UPI0030018931